MTGGTIRYQPTSATAAACRRFIGIELADTQATDKWRTAENSRTKGAASRLGPMAR